MNKRPADGWGPAAGEKVGPVGTSDEGIPARNSRTRQNHQGETMRNQYGPGGIGRVAVIAVIALAITTPASAQFGGLKKKLNGAAAQEGATKAAGGGTIVLT
jgi:hypothetical protein